MALPAPPTEAGVSIPENSLHAVSVSFPLWKQALAWVNMDPYLRGKVKSGYPRFKIHFKIEELVQYLCQQYGREGETAMVFSAQGAARRCRDYLIARKMDEARPVRLVQLTAPKRDDDTVEARIYAVFFPESVFPTAKEYWQHTGEGVSSRQAVYFLARVQPDANEEDNRDVYVEKRFGRNLDLTEADEAKAALRKRIATEIAERKRVPDIKPEHVFLYPSGMTAIFAAHRLVMEATEAQKRELKSVCFGFPYSDTLKVLEKWGPGAIFYPDGTEEDLDKLEKGLDDGSIRISSLYCEVPTNPLLNTPNLVRIRKIADKHGFIVVVDDTVGNMYNVDTLSYADIDVASLTKLFSGDCNVMAGDLILNPARKHFGKLAEHLKEQFTDALWAEDALHLERNSRDFEARNGQVNASSEAVVDLLREERWTPIIKRVYYPKYSNTRANYDALRYPDGGYAGLISMLFVEPRFAMEFYDNLAIAKGPSLGTNFTLGCPYTIMAHYGELEFVESCGVDRNLMRVSVGLEDKNDLLNRFEKALNSALALSKKPANE